MEATGDEEQLDILPAWSLCLLERFDKLQERLILNDIDMLEPSPDDGNTALHWLIKSTSNAFALREKILSEYLVDNPQRCSPTNLNQETPLHTAILSDSAFMAKMLIEHGADLTIRDDLERTPLDLAKELNRTEVVATLRPTSERPPEHSIEILANAREDEGFILTDVL
ncbi:hypothetical protein D6C90_02900 [Aureobasidium pullulans]|uniref:Uncharacterized protein n=1 Tax=Aureobasidium pullulans TaxID=5580 RepID=A0A4S9VFX2_AURPU|nr:hypothetical protein D6C90_02900 [Aureobasidium pullulans]